MKVTIELSNQIIADLVVTALEGGSNHWLNRFVATGYDKPEFYDTPFSITVEYDDPDSDEGQTATAVISNIEFEQGIQLFYLHTRHWEDAIAENMDAYTADCFMQCVILGEVVYG